MANPIFRSHATDLTRHAVDKARSAAQVNHAGLRGQIREIAAEGIFKPFLPADFTIGSGLITDAHGTQSSEADLIIFNPRLLPPILLVPGGREGTFPVEACFYSIEVKSRVTSSEVKDAISKAKNLRGLGYRSGPITPAGISILYPTPRVVAVLFGFDSDLSPDGKSELDRYKEHDQGWNTDPLLPAFCISGVGYWHFVEPGRGWRFWKHTPDYDEVIGFISGISNSLPKILQTRLNPMLGPYLNLQETSDWVPDTR